MSCWCMVSGKRTKTSNYVQSSEGMPPISGPAMLIISGKRLRGVAVDLDRSWQRATEHDVGGDEALASTVLWPCWILKNLAAIIKAYHDHYTVLASNTPGCPQKYLQDYEEEPRYYYTTICLQRYTHKGPMVRVGQCPVPSARSTTLRGWGGMN
jgi:hypothetical protein